MPERHSAAPAPDPTHPADPMPEIEQRKSWLDLSPVQVMGGALAAMTAAGLGSRLSAEGTVVGAALASMIAAVAGAFYTASLRRTSAAVRGVLGGRRTQASSDARSAREPVPSGSTAALPPESGPARTSRRWTLILSSVVGAVAIFALAGGALTLYEAIAGRALSGGDGTTFSQVQQERSENRPSEDRSPAPTDSAEPSESAEPTPTADSSETPQPDPAPTAEPSTEPPVEQPSTEPSATEEAKPSDAAEPPVEEPTADAAPSQNAQTPR